MKDGSVKLIVVDELYPMFYDIKDGMSGLFQEVARVLKTGGQARIPMMFSKREFPEMYDETSRILTQLKNDQKITDFEFHDNILIIYK